MLYDSFLLLCYSVNYIYIYFCVNMMHELIIESSISKTIISKLIQKLILK